MDTTQQPEALAELRERLRSFEADHTPDGWPAVRMRDITALLDDLDNARSDNQVLRLGYAAARLEIESLKAQAVPDLSALTERGAKAWAGVDAQALREGGASPSANAGEPSGHIKEPYTLAEIKAKIASNDYSAEMLLQHAMLLLDSASLSANAGAPANMQVTERMRAAGDCAWMTADRVDSARGFRAMLAAAPAQPAAQQPHRSGCTAGTDEACVQRGCGTNCPAVSPQADSVQEDAALWHWLAEYLVGTRTDLDDEIVASETVNDLRKLVEAAIKQGATQ